ncbi:PREDICTED: receptor-like protein 12 [Ipomoea nil]|uniref:receptor-like protein 12 n=1 Tax=Ipomoea nil TaxID=35883 RepID=UPI00090193C3|nr:PREDICTED: receptor-like protein 12 [Ipomoea nil]
MNGTLPERLGNMFPMLDFLDVSNNILQGVVTENHFVNLKELRFFYASGNRLTLKVGPNWLPPFELSELGLGSWHLGPQFPVWLQSQKEISEVDISNAGIKDEIPTWLWNLSSQLSVLNLPHNQFSGRLPRNTFPITKLDLSNNLFSGDVVAVFSHPQNESIKLKCINDDYIGNKLTGNIPKKIGDMKQLESIDLSRNHFSGEIPYSLSNLNFLSYLNLTYNNLSGKLDPYCILLCWKVNETVLFLLLHPSLPTAIRYQSHKIMAWGAPSVNTNASISTNPTPNPIAYEPKDRVDPLHLHPSETPSLQLVTTQLEGRSNYHPWARAMEMALR